jgi:hypothetical protein
MSETKVATIRSTALTIFVLGQLLIAVWWGGGVNVKLEAMTIAVEKMEVAIMRIELEGLDDRYRGSDARRDHKAIDARMETLKRSLRNHETGNGHK